LSHTFVYSKDFIINSKQFYKNTMIFLNIYLKLYTINLFTLFISYVITFANIYW